MTFTSALAFYLRVMEPTGFSRTSLDYCKQVLCVKTAFYRNKRFHHS